MTVIKTKKTAEVAKSGLKDFNSHHLANIVWAFAKLGHALLALFTAMAQVTQSCLKHFHSQHLVHTVWTFAKLDAEVASGLNDFNSRFNVNTVWAFVKADLASPVLFDAITESIAALQRLQVSQPGEHSLGHCHGQPFVISKFSRDRLLYRLCFSEPGEHRMGLCQTCKATSGLQDFNSQHHANTVWAVVKADHASLVPFDAIADCKYFKDCKSQSLANTAWAFAKHEVPDGVSSFQHLEGLRWFARYISCCPASLEAYRSE